METSEQINCPAPLPEDPADALLTEMRTPAPYEVPEKTKNKGKGTRKSSRRQVVSDSSSDNSKMPCFRENEEEEEEDSPLQPRETRKGRPPQPGRPKGPRREGLSFRTVLPPPPTAKTSGYLGPSPW